MRELRILVDEVGRHRKVSCHPLGVLLAEGLQLVARLAVEVLGSDLVGDMRIVVMSADRADLSVAHLAIGTPGPAPSRTGALAAARCTGITVTVGSAVGTLVTITGSVGTLLTIARGIRALLTVTRGVRTLLTITLLVRTLLTITRSVRTLLTITGV